MAKLKWVKRVYILHCIVKVLEFIIVGVDCELPRAHFVCGDLFGQMFRNMKVKLITMLYSISPYGIGI